MYEINGSSNNYKSKEPNLLNTNIYIRHVMVGGGGRSLGHCGSDTVCVGFSWNDRGGGGGWKKFYLFTHCNISHPESCP